MSDALTNRDVNRAFRERVWPALKAEGFDRRTGRIAWREHRDQIDVVNFWSHNSYNAGVLRINTLSFQLGLAVHPGCRTTDQTPVKDGALRPQEEACDFRLTLTKPFEQEETDRPEIWFVRADGSNLHDIVDAARDHILDAGFAWFATLDGVDRMLDVARHEPLTRYTAAGMGNLGSPVRLELIAALEGARS